MIGLVYLKAGKVCEQKKFIPKKKQIYLCQNKTQIKKLKVFPKLGVEIEDNCRKLLVNKNYKVVYEIVDNDVNILYISNFKLNKYGR